ncbi:MAG: hypothetical protein NTV46_03245 [Verrucomicrobia bacterium]|nr:hypothetical protein [Verrucomicrobiota bacterium]
MSTPIPIILKTLKDRGFALVITLSLMSDPAKTVVLVGIYSVGRATGSTERYVAVPLVEVLGKDSAKPVARFA